MGRARRGGAPGAAPQAGHASEEPRSGSRACTGPAERGWGPDGSAGGAGRHAPCDQYIRRTSDPG
jgi:hypothetical protein